jgi:hypothetical protein
LDQKLYPSQLVALYRQCRRLPDSARDHYFDRARAHVLELNRDHEARWRALLVELADMPRLNCLTCSTAAEGSAS